MATQLAVSMQSGGTKAQGFATPKEEKAPQRMRADEALYLWDRLTASIRPRPVTSSAGK